jgi:hypothetical protein
LTAVTGSAPGPLQKAHFIGFRRQAKRSIQVTVSALKRKSGSIERQRLTVSFKQRKLIHL